MRMRSAISKGERIRVHIWNETTAMGGYWTIVSLHPVPDDEGQLRYYLGVQV